MAEETKAKRRAVNHHFEMGKSAWASVCAGIFYISIAERRAYNISMATMYILDQIEAGAVFVDDRRIADFLEKAEDAEGIKVFLSISSEANQKVVALRERMQRVANHRITTAQVVHFALALAPRPFW